MVRVGFDPRSFSPWDGRSPVSHPTCDVPFPPRRTGGYRKGMIPARPLYQGVRGSVWDPGPSRERVGDWGGLEKVWALLCVAERRATRPNGERGYSTRRHMLGLECPSSIYMYKNDVSVMYSHSKKIFLFFLLHKLHEHILSPLYRHRFYTCMIYY